MLATNHLHAGSYKDMLILGGKRAPARARLPLRRLPAAVHCYAMTRTGTDFDAGVLLSCAWCHNGTSGLHSGK